MGNDRTVRPGILYGIGVGPGDPELLTLKGLKTLQAAPVVGFPAGIGDRAGMAEQIVDQWLQPEQIRLPLHFPYVQDETVLQQAWQAAAATVWSYLNQGQDVAFVSEGDVSFYSTFTYLAQALQGRHPEAIIQTIPGICSPLAAVAQLGIPLTVRDQRLVILPALYQVDELEAALQWADVIVLMKVRSVYAQVWASLECHGLLDRSYLIERATFPDQVIYTGLQSHPQPALSYFSLLIIQVHPAESRQLFP